MGLLQRVKHHRNALDFFLRSQLKWGRPLPATTPIPERHRRLAAELLGFFQKFPWEDILKNTPSKLVIADIGARNFSAARGIEKLYEIYGKKAAIHGIEIDAYRRLVDFRTRADWGHYHASQIKNGHYHAMDFLDWQAPLDVAFFLNPFVTHSPLLAWGLPLTRFAPERLFQHCHKLLKRRHGVVVLSSPDEEEKALCMRWASTTGFQLVSQHNWFPENDSIQKDPRMGSVWRAA